MTWLAWRQFRTQAMVARARWCCSPWSWCPPASICATCTTPPWRRAPTARPTVDCSTAIEYFSQPVPPAAGLAGLPDRGGPRHHRGLLGCAPGGPGARERHLPTGLDPERDPHPWLATKLALVGVASMVVAGLFSLGVTWWFSRMDQLSMNQFSTFDQRDLVAVGYAALAFALGVTAGVLIRRTLPAMAVTLGVFVVGPARRSASWVRPNLLRALHLSQALDPNSMGFFSSNGSVMHLQPKPPNLPNAWIYDHPHRRPRRPHAADRGGVAHLPDAGSRPAANRATGRVGSEDHGRRARATSSRPWIAA